MYCNDDFDEHGDDDGGVNDGVGNDDDDGDHDDDDDDGHLTSPFVSNWLNSSSAKTAATNSD